MSNIPPFGLAVKADAVVDLRIGAGFYLRMKQLQSFLIQGKTQKELEAVIEQLKTGTPASGSWQEQYVTTLIFCKSFEDKAKDSGQYTEVTKEEFERQLGS